MQKTKFDIVFVVLTYRNSEDLKSFITSVGQKISETYKIVIVNSYYDDLSYNEIRNIAFDNGCDFLNVDNKGYGYGNNMGIDYAKNKYIFKFLIVSNPDIELLNFSTHTLNGLHDSIIAPSIKTLRGKNQNPYYYSKIDLVEWLTYYSCKQDNEIFNYIGIIINKIYREARLLIDKILKVKKRKIYASHGSFVIFSYNALIKLGQIYDERMFLFSEENHLARLAFEKSVKTFMVPGIKVLHKEDGSIGFNNSNLGEYMKESFITYYENWN